MRRLRTPFRQRPLPLIPKTRGGYQGLLTHVWLPTGWSLCSRRRFDQRATYDQALQMGVGPCVQCVLIATALNAQADELVTFSAAEGVIPSPAEIEHEMAMLNRPTVNRASWHMRNRVSDR